MNGIARILTDYVIYKGMVKEEERSIYEYGFVVAMETGLSLIIIFFVAGILHMVVEGILFFIVFIPLRSYAGGLHLEHYWSCLALSCLTFSVILLLTKFAIMPTYIVFFIIVFLELLVYCLYPVENINRKVDAVENEFFQKRLKKFLLIDMLIVGICIAFKNNSYLILIMTTFFMVAITMLIGKYKNHRRKLKDAHY
ncbi:accessory gene regulator ArgB-like protein [Roseburia sp. TF10-5]|uniref:accessory gene regulator ArgB-like protein n=1 Tax=Roseburia sp. TF10-5 TaxID=2293144 RepID=UPI000E4765B3|nr:accessory gene regulator B family protein [Roseburia sp. TF10-5]RGI12511.1 hypothetical protein DXD06_10825 [Roseburia sp. TF10-5]